VADGFIVKYDAEGGQAELKPHRDGSVFSFNIALNPAHEFEGGGTWFNSLGESVKIDEGEMVSHASGILHGGNAITSGRRYILVAFVILEGYDSWSMRFYNQIRNL
jgi:predicted 2-oxoglutarate/Fe(II)-dependent dioxygenase YbiX